MAFLDKVIPPGMPSSRAEEWQPLVLYRNSLLHGETDQAPVTTRRAYTRKRRDHGKYLATYICVLKSHILYIYLFIR